MRIELVMAWYDLWVGAYYDRKGGWLYLLPLPCLGIRVRLRRVPKVEAKHGE